MSVPICLYISYDREKKAGERFTDVDLDKRAASQLADYLLAFITEHIPELQDEFEGCLYAGTMGINEMTKSQFNTIYPAIMQACDTIESLAPYKTELKEKLEADERFEAMHKA